MVEAGDINEPAIHCAMEIENADEIRAARGMKMVRERAMLSWGNGIPGGDKQQVFRSQHPGRLEEQ